MTEVSKEEIFHLRTNIKRKFLRRNLKNRVESEIPGAFNETSGSKSITSYLCYTGYGSFLET